jgi:hypothetical protein
MGDDLIKMRVGEAGEAGMRGPEVASRILVRAAEGHRQELGQHDGLPVHVDAREVRRQHFVSQHVAVEAGCH